MGATPDQLKREIDLTRAELRVDMEVLAEHLRPRAVLRRRADDVRSTLREPRTRLVLVGGVGVLVIRRRRRSRRRPT